MLNLIQQTHSIIEETIKPQQPAFMFSVWALTASVDSVDYFTHWVFKLILWGLGWILKTHRKKKATQHHDSSCWLYLLVNFACVRHGVDSTRCGHINTAGVRHRVSFGPEVPPVSRAVHTTAIHLQEAKDSRLRKHTVKDGVHASQPRWLRW